MLDPTGEENKEYLEKLVKVMISSVLILFVVLEMALFMSYTRTNLAILIGSALFLMFIVFWYMGKINFRFR